MVAALCEQCEGWAVVLICNGREHAEQVWTVMLKLYVSRQWGDLLSLLTDSFAVTHLAEVAFLWRWDTVIVTVRWRQRRWVVISATGVSRRWHLREWWGPTWRPPPIWAVALAVQSVPAACPLLLTHLLPLHGFSQEAVIVVISPAPGAAASIPAFPLHVHQIIPAVAAPALEATGSPSVSSPAILRGIVAPPTVIIVAVVAAAGATAPTIIRAEETESNKIKV